MNEAGKWEQLRPHLPADKPTGRPPKDHRRMLAGMLYVLHAGVPCRDLPDRFGPWPSVYDRFNRYRKDGMWDRVTAALTRAATLDHAQRDVDGTVIPAARPTTRGKNLCRRA